MTGVRPQTSGHGGRCTRARCLFLLIELLLTCRSRAADFAPGTATRAAAGDCAESTE